MAGARHHQGVGRLAVVAAGLVYWITLGVPALSTSRVELLPQGRAIADDPGMYWISGALSGVDPHLVVWAVALGAFAVALWAIQPHGLLPTLALVLCAGPAIEAGATYWTGAWAIWASLFAAPVGSGVVAVVATVFRSSAGLPPLAWTFRSWRIGLVVAAAVLALSLTVGGHVLWHTAYIGFGWYANPYDIEYLDESGMAAAARIDPNAAYATPAYEAALRSEVIRIVTTDPGFVLSVILVKMTDAIRDASPLVLLLPLALWKRPALLVPGLLTLAPVLVAGPVLAYETGWFAFVVAAPLVAFGPLWRRDDARVLGAELVPAGRRGEQREQQPA